MMCVHEGGFRTACVRAIPGLAFSGPSPPHPFSLSRSVPQLSRGVHIVMSIPTLASLLSTPSYQWVPYLPLILCAQMPAFYLPSRVTVFPMSV